MSVPPMPQSLKPGFPQNKKFHRALKNLIEGNIFTEERPMETLIEEAYRMEYALALYAQEHHYLDGVMMRELEDGDLEEDGGQLARNALRLEDYPLSDGPLVVVEAPIDPSPSTQP